MRKSTLSLPMQLTRPLLARTCSLVLASMSAACNSSPDAESNAAQSASAGGTGKAPSTTSAGAGAKAPAGNGNAGSTAAATSNNTSKATAGSHPTTTTAASPSQAGSGGTHSAQTAGNGAAATSGSSAATSSNAGAPAAGSGNTGAAGSTAASAANSCQGSLCESFEAFSGDTLDPSWEVSTSNCMGTGKVSVDGTLAHTGTHSIKVAGGAGFCNHVFFRPKPSTWMPSAPVYARFFVRLEKPLTQSHVTFLALHDDAEMKDLRMGGQSEILMWNRESDDATLPELSPTGIAASVKPETGKWLCVELLIDSQAPKLETWLNGEAVKGLTVEGDPTPDIDAQWQRKADWHPKLSDIRFGWESYGGDVNTLWFDDVVLGTTRVGCEH